MMYVVKRDGKQQSCQFDKIQSRISKLCYGLDSKVRAFFRRLRRWEWGSFRRRILTGWCNVPDRAVYDGRGEEGRSHGRGGALDGRPVVSGTRLPGGVHRDSRP